MVPETYSHKLDHFLCKLGTKMSRKRLFPTRPLRALHIPQSGIDDPVECEAKQSKSQSSQNEKTDGL